MSCTGCFSFWSRGSGPQGVAAQDVEVGGPYAEPAGRHQFGVQGETPSFWRTGLVVVRRPEISVTARRLRRAREDAPDAVEEGRLVVDPPVDQAAGDEGVGGVRKGGEVGGGDVQALPGRPLPGAGAGVVGGGECDCAGGAVDAGRPVAELVVAAAGQGAVPAADVEGGDGALCRGRGARPSAVARPCTPAGSGGRLPAAAPGTRRAGSGCPGSVLPCSR